MPPDTRRLSWIAPYSRYVEFECRRCPRRGRYALARLYAQHGNMLIHDLFEMVGADCPRKAATADVYGRCQKSCPTLLACYRAGAT